MVNVNRSCKSRGCGTKGECLTSGDPTHILKGMVEKGLERESDEVIVGVKTILFESAEYLGKIHLGLKDIDYLREGFSKEWFDEWSVEKSINNHKKIIIDVKNSINPYSASIINAC